MLTGCACRCDRVVVREKGETLEKGFCVGSEVGIIVRAIEGLFYDWLERTTQDKRGYARNGGDWKRGEVGVYWGWGLAGLDRQINSLR